MKNRRSKPIFSAAVSMMHGKSAETPNFRRRLNWGRTFSLVRILFHDGQVRFFYAEFLEFGHDRDAAAFSGTLSGSIPVTAHRISIRQIDAYFALFCGRGRFHYLFGTGHFNS
jgi:hypothetical protein